MRRFLAAAAVLALIAQAPRAQALSPYQSTGREVLPRVVMIQPVRVTYVIGKDDVEHQVDLAARDEAEARLMLRSYLAEAPHEVRFIELLDGTIGARRDGYLPVPPSPFRR